MDNIYDYTKVRKQIDGCVCGGGGLTISSEIQNRHIEIAVYC